MEKTSGNQRPEKEHGKDQVYDLQQKPALTQRLRKTPMVYGVNWLVVIQSSAVDFNLVYTRNVVVLKVD